MKYICEKSGHEFNVTDDDLQFYARLDVPVPTLCPDERQRRRLSWRNERNLYQGKCDFCGRSMLSLYHPDSEFKVYCQDCWWSDRWDAKDFGRDFDFDRSFFEQFSELLRDVPMFGLVNGFNALQNCDYVNYTMDAKNCYLCIATNYLEDCMYSAYVWESRDSLDCSYCTGLELCYECLDCDGLYSCKYLQNSRNCTDCVLSNGLLSCENCFGCVNLRNKKYYFYNESLGKEEYENRVREILNTPGRLDEEMGKFYDFSLKFPRKYAQVLNCEKSTGDGIRNCKNVHACFEGYGGEDLKWVINFPGDVKDCYDISGCAKLELSVDSAILVPAYGIKYSNGVFNNGTNITCCAFLDGGHDLFGSAGLKKSKYCIFNKQYSESEYFELRDKIIDHMKKTSEWGEFFPIGMSPFPYNDSCAHEMFPLGKDEALNRGYTWLDKDVSSSNGKSLQDDVLSCTDCEKQYRIDKSESAFYKKMNLFVPKNCHQCRHENRLKKRPDRKIWDRKCDKCDVDIASVYSPDRPEIVYCEDCYLGEVY